MGAMGVVSGEKFMKIAKEHKRKGIEETLVRVIMRGLPKDDEIHRLLGVITEAADAFEKGN